MLVAYFCTWSIFIQYPFILEAFPFCFPKGPICTAFNIYVSPDIPTVTAIQQTGKEYTVICRRISASFNNISHNRLYAI